MLPSFYQVKEVKTSTGAGFQFICPLCSGANGKQKSTLAPLSEGSEQWMFACENGMTRGKTSSCGKRMRLQDFIALYNPPLHRRYMRDLLTPEQYKEWKRCR